MYRCLLLLSSVQKVEFKDFKIQVCLNCVLIFRFGDKVKVVHFLGQLKPWMYGYNLLTGKVIAPSSRSQPEHLEHVQKWWNIFMSQVQPNLSPQCVS